MTVTWHEDQKRLTVDQVQGASFPPARRGRRGYDEEAVRAFTRIVERELVSLLNEKVALWNEVERLRRRIINTANAAPTGGGKEGVLFGKEDAHVHAVRILSSAQLTADRYVADAQAFSQQLTEEARTRRDQILSRAQESAELVLAEASSRARDAAVAALNNPPPPQMEANRSAMRAELAYLRAFGEVYRTHLRAYTEGMLRSIDEWERKEANSISETRNEMAGLPSIDFGNGHFD